MIPPVPWRYGHAGDSELGHICRGAIVRVKIPVGATTTGLVSVEAHFKARVNIEEDNTAGASA